MADSALPSKLFFRIGEVASLVGVEPHVLRYWEREFRSIRPTKSAKGQRVYSRKDVENLLRVRDLLYRDGFTIAGAKKRLQRSLRPEDEAVALAVPADEVRRGEKLGEGDDDAAGPAPESGPREAHVDVSADAHRLVDAGRTAREKLTALRAEIEGFLDELDDTSSTTHAARNEQA